MVATYIALSLTSLNFLEKLGRITWVDVVHFIFIFIS